MPVLHQLQPSFNNGEISPLLYDRVDFQKFVSSVKTGKNMFVHPQGGVSNRAGTVMLAQAKDEVVRLIPFEFSSNETYVIEFGNGYCRFYTADGQVVTSSNSPYEIESPFTTQDLSKIRYCQTGDVMYIAWGGVPKVLNRYGHTNWAFSDYDYQNGPLQIEEFSGAVTTEVGRPGGRLLFGSSYSGNSSGGWAQDLSNPVFCEQEEVSNYTNILFSANGIVFSWQKYSLDGINWISYPNGYKFSCVIEVSGVYYALLYGDDSDLAVYTFTTPSLIQRIPFQNAPFTSFARTINSLKYANGRFYLIVYAPGTYNRQIVYTTDFANWVKRDRTFSSNLRFEMCLHNNKIYVPQGDGYGPYVFDYDLNVWPTPSVPSNYYYTNNFIEHNGVLFTNIFLRNDYNNKLAYLNDDTNTFVFPSNSVELVNNIFSISDGLYLNRGYNNDVYVSKYDHSVQNVVANYNNLRAITRIVDYTVSATQAGYSLTANDFTFTTQDINRNYEIEFKLAGTELRGSISTGSGDSGRNGYSSVSLAQGSCVFYTSGTWGGHVDIEYSKDNATWSVYRSYSSSKDVNYNRTIYFDELVFVRIHYVIGAGPQVLTYEFTIPEVHAYFYTYGQSYLSATSIYIGIIDNQTMFDYCLSEGSHLCTFRLYLWSNIDSWPTEVDLYQDRIVWATNNEIDATKISDYKNFGVSSEVNEDDAISVIIKDKKIDKINSIVAGQKLAVYSDDGNFVHNNDTFTPQSATFLKQGATGGSDVKPVVVRDHIIYAHPMKQAISDYAYNFETDGYAGQDITLLANHLFDGKVIKTLAYQQEPYSIIWVLQEEGTVLACTYLRQQNVIAWTPMDFGGKVLSIAVCSTGTEEHLYLAVERENGTFVEKMPTRLLSSDPEECFFVDCGRTYRGDPATAISGLDYLEGQNVVALADGNVVKNLVVTNGQITLPIPASVVTVGLPYESVLETLTFDVNTGDGSSLNRKKRVVAVSIRYNASRGSKLSVNGHTEVDMLRREQEGYNIPIALKSGVYREIVASTHDEKTAVKIRQDEPLPITIVSITPEIEYER